ncbi:MAG: ABC transporter permease [Kouleothrix sp.]|jgi:NitT/TauT family transport system permease protein|nr:ABC transporter permease [Kouleothrix sp.]
MVRQQLLAYSPRPGEAGQPREHLRRRVPAGAGLAISLIVGVLIWKLVVLLRDYPSFILPAPELVFQRLITELTSGTLRHHAGLTLIEALGGFSLALGVSLALGYLLAHAPRLERIIAPQLAATQSVPVVAIAPLIILWVGADIRSKILVAALVTFFPILSSTIVALRSVPRELLEMAKISGASRRQALWHVELPLALPGIFAGVKSGLALATTGAVVGEFVGARDGLGALINISRGLFDTPLMFVALISLAGLTLSFYLAAVVLEWALVRWEP